MEPRMFGSRVLIAREARSRSMTGVAMSNPTNSSPWSERDLLVLYAALSMGTSIPDIAAALNRSVDEVSAKAASLKSQSNGADHERRPTAPK
jgi:hypothetical protein